MADLGSFTASVSGLSGIVSALQAVVDSVHEQAHQAISTAVDSTYDMSQPLVAVDTGDLKASGIKQKSDLEGSVTYSTDHCWFVELGTVKMSAQPYLLPAFDSASRQLESDLQGIKP